MTTAGRILAFDAAGSACSAAVWSAGRIVAHRFEAMRRGQSERLVPMIQDVMGEAGLDYRSLDVLAVTTGPGGFTGVRIGLATARGLALACGRPVLGIGSFEAAAAAVPAAERRARTLAVLLDAKRSELYYQAFDEDLTPLTEPACVAPDALGVLLPAGLMVLTGNAVEQGLAGLAGSRAGDLEVSTARGETDAVHVAALAAARPRPAPNAPPPQPLYLRAPDVNPPPRV